MADVETKDKLYAFEEKLRRRYSLLSKLFILLTVLLVSWVVIVIFSVYILRYGYNWALLPLNDWILLVSILFLIFIVLELIFYFHYSSVKNKIVELEKPKPEFINGKRVHVYTYPEGVEGGIFSKTYVGIDEHNVLRLRTLMVPPDELWSQKTSEQNTQDIEPSQGQSSKEEEEKK